MKIQLKSIRSNPRKTNSFLLMYSTAMLKVFLRMIQALAASIFLLGFHAFGTEISAKIAEWRIAADKGDAKAQCNLAICYSIGQGVPKSSAESVKWYRKAAELGNAQAQYNLGVCYMLGEVVAKNQYEAVKLYQKAATQGYARAQYDLGVCFEKGKGIAQNKNEAVKWYNKAAEQGDPLAQFNLGGCYGRGEGVVKNEIEGYKWSLLAAAHGVEAAKQNISFYEERLSPNLKAEGQRLAQEWETKHAKQDPAEVEERRPGTAASGNEPKVTGTGFMITRNGYLITNHHVVKGSSKVRVQTSAGLISATIVRVDAASDLALLKVTGSFEALPVVSSRAIRLGAMVATVGFPNIGLQGFEPKLSKGDISSLAGIQDDVKQFQISVPVQPGNSGGALVDERGNVVGVVTAQLNQKAALESTGTLAQNVNYAVKSSYLLSFLEAVPEVGSGLLEAKTNEQKFEAVVDDVKKATVLIVGY